MDEATARAIKYLRRGPVTHSWRRIAEIATGLAYWLQQSGYRVTGVEDNQLVGQDMCQEACKELGEDWNE